MPEQEKTEAGTYELGSTAEVQIDMWNIVYTLLKGSRIPCDSAVAETAVSICYENYKKVAY